MRTPSKKTTQDVNLLTSYLCPIGNMQVASCTILSSWPILIRASTTA